MTSIRALLRSEPGFRNRGEHSSRLEALTDAVFGFALTLVIVTLEVPGTFSALLGALVAFVPFSLCLALLLWLWHEHCIYFRRYGMTDAAVVALNGVLLLVVLLFVFPLKFLASYLFNLVQGDFAAIAASGASQRGILLLYSGGLMLVLSVFCSLYCLAWSRREALELDPSERSLTRASIGQFLGFAAVTALVMVVALVLPDRFAGYAGFLYGAFYPAAALTIRIVNRTPAA